MATRHAPLLARAALLPALALMACSKVTMLRTAELRRVQDQVREVRSKVDTLNRSVDELSVKQGGATSKMRADLATMINDLQTQLTRLSSQIEEAQYQMNQLGLKIDKLDRQRVVVGGKALPPGATHADSAKAMADTAVRVVEGLDLDNLYNQALEDYRTGKYELAFQGFKTVYDKDQGGSYKENALYWMGECYLKADKLDKALEQYQRALQEYPRGGKVCSVRFKIGLVYDRKGDKKKRDEAWKGLQNACPGSNEAQRAADLMRGG